MLSRTNFLPRVLVVALLGAAPIVTACGAKTVSLGNTGATTDKLQTRPVATVPTSVTASCPAGYAHPNICCEAAADEDPTCGAWTNDPFRACESGWSTYPNALECCSLSDPSKCNDTPDDAGVVASPPPSYGCGFSCPPGWYAPASNITPAGEAVGCCQALADGTTACEGIASTSPVLTGTTTCASPPSSGPTPILSADAGVFEDGGEGLEDAGYSSDDSGSTLYDDAGPYCEDAGSTYPSGYDGGGASLCGVCPTGWSPNALDPVLCCQTTAANVTECFSQATGTVGSGYPIDDDAGTTTIGVNSSEDGGAVSVPVQPTDASVGSATIGCGGDSDSCSCQNDANGHVYTMDCSVNTNGTSSCFCETDGNVTKQLTGPSTVCSAAGEVSTTFTSATGCGYPAF